MRTKASIYSDGNPQLVKLFEQAGHPAKVMCVALDYAKAQHTARFCNGQGCATGPCRRKKHGQAGRDADAPGGNKKPRRSGA